MKRIKTLSEARDFLYEQVPQFDKRKFPGQLGLDRTRELMKLLGDPQEKLKIIHIAGTSGKGSTAYFISTLLQGFGFNVGLSVSPHLVDIRERAQLNGKLLPEKDYVDLLNDILPAFEALKKTKYGAPTYFELVQALAFLVFYKKKVDYAVIETGLGGTLDATNVVSNPSKICVITKIGLDHTKILGPTIKDIASQKAGIIQKGNLVITCDQKKDALGVLNESALLKKTKLISVKRENNFRNIKVFLDKTVFDFKYKDLIIKNLVVSARGIFQAQNLSLALAAAFEVSIRDKFLFSENKIRSTISKAYFAGRFDVKKVNGTTLVIDGAHNPQKMRAFLNSLMKLFPGETSDFLLAFKKGKDYRKMLRQITPLANKIYITSFFAKSDMKDNMSEDPRVVADFIKKLRFKNVEIIETPENALSFLLLDSQRVKIVVTGSLYLAGEIYSALDKNYKEG